MSLIGVFTLLSAGAFVYYGAMFALNTILGSVAMTALKFPFKALKAGFNGLHYALHMTKNVLIFVGQAMWRSVIMPIWTGVIPAIGAAIVSTNTWAASMLGLSATIYGIPILGWILAVVAALIAIGVAIYKNWDAITAFFSGMWAKFKDFLPKAKAWGAELIASIKNGIVSAAPTLFAALDGVVKFARGFFPASPAKRGAFKDLHRIKIIEQVANAVRPNALSSALGRATDTAMGAFAPAPSMAAQTIGGGTVSVNYSPTINFGGGGTSEDKQSFLDVLNSHKDEIARMVNDAVRSNERRRF
jgi:hypothetical protein